MTPRIGKMTSLRARGDEHGREDGSSRMRDDHRMRQLALGSAIWLAVYAVALAFTNANADHLSGKILNDGFYLVPVALAALVSLVAARHDDAHRRFWQILAASNALWLIGELIWSAYVVVNGDAPFPSVADAFYLSSYMLVPVAVLVAFGASRPARALRSVLDGSIAAVALGACGYVLTISPQLSSGFSLATATGIAYPLLGVLILVLIVGLGLAAHETVPTSIVLVAAAFLVSAVTDAGYTYVSVLHSFIPGQWLNLGWQAEALLLTFAGVAAVRHPERKASPRRFERDIGLPVVLAGVAVTGAFVAIDAGDGRLTPAALLAAGYCLLATMTRLYLTGRDRERLARDLEHALAEQERLAVTDALTSLHNRRFFDELLTLEAERSVRYQSPLALLVIDCDHFKAVNDTHGHPVGDDVLVEAARRIRDSVRSSDVVARYGGEEFAVILTGADEAAARVTAQRIRQAIGGDRIPARDHHIPLTVSVGLAVMPEHANTKDELLRTADRALYQAKRLGRNQVQVGGPDADEVPLPRDTSPVLDYLQNLADEIDARQGPTRHSVAMSACAGRIAELLGEGEELRERAVLAARFHDIGKVAVPDSILLKPGSLADDEWRVIREHPEQGARLAQLAPELRHVAPIIRAHHERMDGAGYPLGLNGEQIPLEARIIAVCDAWEAMLAERPYRRPLTQAEALEQLRRGSGTQFDPVVVSTFVALLEETSAPAERDAFDLEHAV